jgi:cholesterol transport system auxiliary component
MNHTRITVAPLLLILGALLTACSVLPRAQSVTVERFTLDVRPAEVANPMSGSAVLLVTRPVARADLDTPRMVYRQQDYSVRYFARSRWADSPAQLLLPGLVEALEASGYFAAVVRVGSAATPGLRLDTELLDFSQDFRVEPSVFRLRLRAQLSIWTRARSSPAASSRRSTRHRSRRPTAAHRRPTSPGRHCCRNW